jgi:hypothetical protein
MNSKEFLIAAIIKNFEVFLNIPESFKTDAFFISNIV